MKPQARPRARSLRRRTSLPSRWLLACAVAFAVAGPAQADAVTVWNATADAVAPRFGSPQQQARAMAIVHIAVHDALNSIDPRYQSYTGVIATSAGASPDAAIATAAHHTLLGLLDAVPDSPLKTQAIATVNGAYDAALVAIPDGAAKTSGIATGEATASAILALRENDGSANPHRLYSVAASPGVYQPTPSTPDPGNPAVVTPTFEGWAELVPFALHSGAQFRVDPGEIFDLTSAAYTREYTQVMEQGDARVRGVAPDSEESDIARFWASGGANWNPVTRRIVAGLGLDAWQNARLFALVNIATSDAHIATQDSKYAYKFWRPVTAINWTDDGNPDTVSDAFWRPLVVTPSYPDYPCSLPTAASASAESLRRFFGTDGVAFSRTANAAAVPLPPPLAPMPAKTIVRHFDSLSEAADEAAISRVYAGLHFYSGCRASVRLGRQVARFTFQHYLKPLK